MREHEGRATGVHRSTNDELASFEERCGQASNTLGILFLHLEQGNKKFVRGELRRLVDEGVIDAEIANTFQDLIPKIGGKR